MSQNVSDGNKGPSGNSESVIKQKKDKAAEKVKDIPVSQPNAKKKSKKGFGPDPAFREKQEAKRRAEKAAYKKKVQEVKDKTTLEEKAKSQVNEERMRFLSNSYDFAPYALTGGGMNYRWKFKSRRPSLPKFPSNLPDQVTMRLFGLFSHKTAPFMNGKEPERSKVVAAKPFTNTLARIFASYAAYVYVNESKDASSAHFTLSVIGSYQYLGTIASVLVKMKAARGWQTITIRHYNDRATTHGVSGVGYELVPITLKATKGGPRILVDGQEITIQEPTVIVFDCQIDSLSMAAVENSLSKIYQVGYMRPKGLVGAIGYPYPETTITYDAYEVDKDCVVIYEDGGEGENKVSHVNIATFRGYHRESMSGVLIKTNTGTVAIGLQVSSPTGSINPYYENETISLEDYAEVWATSSTHDGQLPLRNKRVVERDMNPTTDPKVAREETSNKSEGKEEEEVHTDQSGVSDLDAGEDQGVQELIDDATENIKQAFDLIKKTAEIKIWGIDDVREGDEYVVIKDGESSTSTHVEDGGESSEGGSIESTPVPSDDDSERVVSRVLTDIDSVKTEDEIPRNERIKINKKKKRSLAPIIPVSEDPLPRIPVIASANRANGPNAPPFFTLLRNGTWGFTRAAVIWLLKNGFTYDAAPAYLGSALLLFPGITRWCGSAILLRSCFHQLQKSVCSELDDLWLAQKHPVDLPESDNAILTRMVATNVAADLTKSNLGTAVASIARTINYKGDASDLYPNYIQSKRQQLQMLESRTPQWKLVMEGFLIGALGYTVTQATRSSSLLSTIGTLGRFVKSCVRTIPVLGSICGDVGPNPDILHPNVYWATILVMGILGPVAEEVGKRLLGKVVGQKTAGYTFGAYEALSYCSSMAERGYPLRIMAIRRIPALIMHSITGHLTFVQAIMLHAMFNSTLIHLSYLYHRSLRMNSPFPSVLKDLLGMFVTSPVVPMVVLASILPLITKHIRTPKKDIPVGTAAPSVCTHFLPLKEIRPDAKLTLRREPQNCRSGIVYRNCGPTVSTHKIFSFRSCEHNMLAACTSRMAGIPAAVDHNGEQIDKNVEERMGRAADVIAEITGSVDLDSYSIEDWLKRFPAHKAIQLYKEYDQAHNRYSRKYEAFVKREKSVACAEDLDYICPKIEKKDPKIHDKPIHTNIKLDPRGISVPAAETRVHTGPWCMALNRGLTRCQNDQIFYAPGHTPKELSEWFQRAVEKVSSGVLPWAIAVQGDDNLTIYKNKLGVVVFVMSDMSRYDMSIRVSHMAQVWRLLSLMGVRQDKSVDVIKDQQGQTGMDRHYVLPFGWLKIPGTMASGDGTTITFNSLILELAVVSWLRRSASLETFEQDMKDLGFTATYSHCTQQNILSVDFLQSRPWLTSSGYRVFGPKPGRILSRFFWTDRSHRNQEGYMREARTMAIGLLPLTTHIPIINDVVQRVLILTSHLKMFNRQDDCPFEIKEWKMGSSEKESELTEHEMSTLYDVPVEDIRHLRRRIHFWEWGEYIDHDQHLSGIVRKICAVDLM